jgi:hypothetical protein
LNPIVEVVVAPCDEPTLQIEEEDNNMFNVGTPMEKSSQAFVIKKNKNSKAIYSTIYVGGSSYFVANP